MSATAATGRASVVALRTALERAGYDEARLREALALRGRFVGPVGARRELHLRRVGDTGVFASLVRLFLLEEPVPAEAAVAALAPLGVDDAATLGLVRRDGDRVAPLVRIAPYDGLTIVSDAGRWRDASTPPDVVPGLSEVGVTLARLTPRDDVGLTLDLGTGSGLHALLASRHSERVVATDVNPRALAYAQLNAELNGIANVELRLGSLFEPVGDLAFDLIVSNPPFVLGPDERYIFRDGGRGFVERVLRGASLALAPDGVAVVTASWGSPDAPRLWVADTACDAVVVRIEEHDPLTNGWLWTGNAAEAQRWADANARDGFAAISYGAVAMRRSGWTEHVTEVDVGGRDIGVVGSHLVRMLENASWLGSRRSIAGEPIRAAPDLELRRTEQLGESEDPPRSARLALRRGLPVTLPADAGLLEALRAGAADDGPAIRRAVELGFVLPR